jgi:hypothetical protein
MSVNDLEARVSKLERAVATFSEELRLAFRYIQSDAASSLTKSRLVMEKVLREVFTLEMGQEPRKPLLGEMLADNQFTRKIERRILSRMNAIRDMGNLGPHGETVEPSDAAKVLDDLCEVLDWYLRHYTGREPAFAGALPRGGPTTGQRGTPAAKQSRAAMPAAARHPNWKGRTLVLAILVGLLFGGYACWNGSWFRSDSPRKDRPSRDDQADQFRIKKGFAYTLQVRFLSPEGMRIAWLIGKPPGKSASRPRATPPPFQPPGRDEPPNPSTPRPPPPPPEYLEGALPPLAEPSPPLQLPGSDARERYRGGPWTFAGALKVPARYNFKSGGRYQLRFSDIEGFPASELYPSLEVRHSPKQEALGTLRSSAIRIDLTRDDFGGAVNGTEVIKVWYLNPAGQLVELRQPPLSRTDPLADTGQLGTPLVIFRMGNFDFEAPNTPVREDP